MKNRFLLLVFAIFYCSVSGCFASSFLTDEQILGAQELAQAGMKCEDFRAQENTKESDQRKDYLTLENYKFVYKTNTQQFLMAVGFYHGGNWGHVAVYPGDVKPETIKYVYGEFSDLGKAAQFLSTIKFEYVPASEEHPAYIVLERVDAGCYAEGKGYSQACTSYFINEFITNHTTVDFVFSDARNGACQVFFPRYGLMRGMPESFKTVKFSRPARVPFYWQRGQ